MNVDNPPCDEAFGMYLREMSLRLTLQGYTQVTYFISTLRQCLNLRCDSIPGDKLTSTDPYSQVNTPQYLPEAANLFICEFLESEDADLTREDAIAMMLHFTRWLFVKKFTTLQLSLCDKT